MELHFAIEFKVNNRNWNDAIAVVLVFIYINIVEHISHLFLVLLLLTLNK